jgi:hypothetical protein
MSKSLEARLAVLEYKLKVEKKKRSKEFKGFEVAVQQIADHFTDQIDQINARFEEMGATEIASTIGFQSPINEEDED